MTTHMYQAQAVVLEIFSPDIIILIIIITIVVDEYSMANFYAYLGIS